MKTTMIGRICGCVVITSALTVPAWAHSPPPVTNIMPARRDMEQDEHVGFFADYVPDPFATLDPKCVGRMDVVAVLTKVVHHQQGLLAERTCQMAEQQEQIAEQEEEMRVVASRLAQLEKRFEMLRKKDEGTSPFGEAER